MQRKPIQKPTKLLPDLNHAGSARARRRRRRRWFQQVASGVIEPPHGSIIAPEDVTTVDNVTTAA
jgi:hypothetical protein